MHHLDRRSRPPAASDRTLLVWVGLACLGAAGLLGLFATGDSASTHAPLAWDGAEVLLLGVSWVARRFWHAAEL